VGFGFACWLLLVECFELCWMMGVYSDDDWLMFFYGDS